MMTGKCSSLIVLYLRYFEKGYGLSHYLFKLIAIFGIVSQDINSTAYILAVYTLLCFGVGWAWHHYGFMEKQIELNNKFDPFVREMRNKTFK